LERGGRQWEKKMLCMGKEVNWDWDRRRNHQEKKRVLRKVGK